MFVFKKLFSFFLLSSSLILLCSTAHAQSSKKIKTIIVDAGHGGTDDDAHSEYKGSLNYAFMPML